MDNSENIEALLIEIRDLQKAQLDEYAAQAARSVALAEEAVERQQRFGQVYRRVLLVSGILVALLLAFLVNQLL